LIVVFGAVAVLLPTDVTKADSPPYGSIVSDAYIFRRVSQNSEHDIHRQLTLVLSTYDYDVDNDPNTNEVLFTFWNNQSGSDAPIDSSICDVYFDDGPLLNLAAIVNSKGVKFSRGARPRDFSGGNGMVPPFKTTKGFSSDSDSPTSHNGVNPGEWLGVVFTLGAHDDGTPMTFYDVDRALLVGTFLNKNLPPGVGPDDPLAPLNLRIGVHVQGLPDDGESDLYVQHVPVPGAAILGVVGLACMGISRRRMFFGSGGRRKTD